MTINGRWHTEGKNDNPCKSMKSGPRDGLAKLYAGYLSARDLRSWKWRCKTMRPCRLDKISSSGPLSWEGSDFCWVCSDWTQFADLTCRNRSKLCRDSQIILEYLGLATWSFWFWRNDPIFFVTPGVLWNLLQEVLCISLHHRCYQVLDALVPEEGQGAAATTAAAAAANRVRVGWNWDFTHVRDSSNKLDIGYLIGWHKQFAFRFHPKISPFFAGVSPHFLCPQMTSGGLASIDGSAVWYGKTSGDLDIDRLPWFGTSCNMFTACSLKIKWEWEIMGIEELQQEKQVSHWWLRPLSLFFIICISRCEALWGSQPQQHTPAASSHTWRGQSLALGVGACRNRIEKNVRSLETSLDLRITS